MTHLALYVKNFTRIEELFANDIEVTFLSLIYQIDFYAYTCSKYATFWRLVELTAQVIGKKEVQQVISLLVSLILECRFCHLCIHAGNNGILSF